MFASKQWREGCWRASEARDGHSARGVAYSMRGVVGEHAGHDALGSFLAFWLSVILALVWCGQTNGVGSESIGTVFIDCVHRAFVTRLGSFITTDSIFEIPLR